MKTVEKDRWKNRRRMAWISLVSGILYPIIVLITESAMLTALATSFYVFISAVVGAYVGFATVDNKWQNETNNILPPAPSGNEFPDIPDDRI